LTKPTFIIAEAGVNHNGSLDIARNLIDVAADAGADAVKFQTFRADKLVTRRARKAGYQVANTGEDGNQLEMLKALELSAADHEVLARRCRERNIRFMSTPFDAESLAFLVTLDMPAIKIASGDITFGPLLLAAAQCRMPLIVSTGMATLGEIEDALAVIAFGLTRGGAPAGRTALAEARSTPEGRAALQECVTLLHCVTQYPAPAASVNLRAMDTMAAAFGLPVGYSDHTLGIAVSIAAVARGAAVIEKHFTIDRNMAGPDHAASLEPDELRAMIAAIRMVESALGSQLKGPAPEELGNRRIARRSLVWARPVAKGESITMEMLTAKRPDDGLSPMESWSLVGRAVEHAHDVDDPIEP
jgi:N-acetylneuraminate synthase